MTLPQDFLIITFFQLFDHKIKYIYKDFTGMDSPVHDLGWGLIGSAPQTCQVGFIVRNQLTDMERMGAPLAFII